MATLTGPSTLGPGLLAFLDAYQKAQQAARQDEALGRQNALASLQMNEILRKRQEGELDRAALAALPTVVPPPVVTPPMEPTPEQTARMESAFTEPIPATPPPAPGGLTPQVLAQQIGPDKTARILGTEQGRAAFGAMGGMTAEAWEAKKRAQDFRTKAKDLYRTGVAAQNAGDPYGDVDARRAILAAAMDVTDPKDYHGLLAEVTKLDALRKSIKDEEQYAKEDGPKLGRGRQLLIKGHMEGDPDMAAEGYRLISEATKTKYGREGAAQLFNHLEPKLIEKGQLYQGPLGEIEQRVNVTLKQKAMQGPITNADRVAALRADYAANPRQWGSVLAAFAQSGKEVPRDYQVAATGAYFTKNETMAAADVAAQNPQDPNAFITALQAINAAKRKRPDEHAGLIRLYGSVKDSTREMRLAVDNARRAIQREENEGRTPDPTMYQDLRKAQGRYETAVKSQKIHREHLRAKGLDLPKEADVDEEAEEKRAAASAADRIREAALKKNPKLTKEQLVRIIKDELRRLGF